MPASLAPRPWLPDAVSQRVAGVGDLDGAGVAAEAGRLVEENQRIHEVECVNLDATTNVMNPRAEAILSAQIGSRPSLPEIVRRGVTPEDAPELAGVVARALDASSDLRSLGEEVTRWRAGFTGMHFLAG